MEAWQGWSPAGPDELAASLLITASGDPEEPPGVNVFGAMLGAESDTEELLEDLVARVGADPASASLEHATYRETKRYLAEHGPGDDRPDGHPYSKSEFFRRPLPAEAIESLVETFSKERVAGQSRAGLHALGRRLQPRVCRGHGLRPPRGSSCSSMRSPSSRTPGPARRKPPCAGSGARGRWSARGGPDARTRTSRTRISKTGRARTTGPAWSGWCASRRDTTRTTSSASPSRSRVTVHRLREEP